MQTAKALSERLGVTTLLAVLQVLDQTVARMRISVHERTLADMAADHWRWHGAHPHGYPVRVGTS